MLFMEERRKKKRIRFLSLVIVIVIAAAAAYIVISKVISKPYTVTSSTLEKVIQTSELSTSKFVYNGIAEKPEKYHRTCYLRYQATVKVGVDLKDVTVKVNEADKTVTPILPPVQIGKAVLNEDEIDVIHKPADMHLSEEIKLCKADAEKEAKASKKLRRSAEENLKAEVEALLMPVLEEDDYTIKWQ